MKILFALFVSLVLIGIIIAPGRQLEPAVAQALAYGLAEAPAAYRPADQDFYRDAQPELFSDALLEEIRPTEQLETISEAETSWTTPVQTSLRPYRLDQPKVSKPKE